MNTIINIMGISRDFANPTKLLFICRLDEGDLKAGDMINIGCSSLKIKEVRRMQNKSSAHAPNMHANFVAVVSKNEAEALPGVKLYQLRDHSYTVTHQQRNRRSRNIPG